MMGLREYGRHRRRLGLPGGALRAVQVAIRDGRLDTSLTPDRKKIRSAKAADAEWAASTNEDRVPLSGPTAPAVSAPSAPSPLADARARRETVNAERAEMELAELRGQLVNAQDVEARLITLFGGIRTKLLGIPARAAQRDPTMTPEQLAMIDDLLRECLTDLADNGA
jgi:phage terminase Nu1 subunit (DNA packaging protein)